VNAIIIKNQVEIDKSIEARNDDILQHSSMRKPLHWHAILFNAKVKIYHRAVLYYLFIDAYFISELIIG